MIRSLRVARTRAIKARTHVVNALKLASMPIT
jgi:hypothetical protein